MPEANNDFSNFDDKNYKAYTSATQQTINSSNAAWLIKILQFKQYII